MSFVVETDKGEFYSVIDSVKAIPYGNTIRFTYDGTYGIDLCRSYEEAVSNIRNKRVFARTKIISQEEGGVFSYENNGDVVISAGKIKNIFKI